jgi:hypothetical protein
MLVDVEVVVAAKLVDVDEVCGAEVVGAIVEVVDDEVVAGPRVVVVVLSTLGWMCIPKPPVRTTVPPIAANPIIAAAAMTQRFRHGPATATGVVMSGRPSATRRSVRVLTAVPISAGSGSPPARASESAPMRSEVEGRDSGSLASAARTTGTRRASRPLKSGSSCTIR